MKLLLIIVTFCVSLTGLMADEWIGGSFRDGYRGYAIAEVWNYDIDQHQWTAVSPLPDHGAGGGRFGHDHGQDDQTRAAVHDPQSGFRSCGPGLPRPHFQAEDSRFLSNGCIVTMGGLTRDRNSPWIDNGIVTRLPGARSQIVGEFSRRLSSTATAIIGDRLYVAGGSLNGLKPLPGMWFCSVSGFAAKSSKTETSRPDSDGGVSSESLSQAKDLLNGAITKGDVAGASHLVICDGRTVHFEVAGRRDIEDGKPFEADTILRIYSMTKPITSVTAITLYEKGKFQLDDPVSKFIPSFEKTMVLVKDRDAVRIVPAKRQITVRDVFRHTTGYSYGDGNPNPREYYEREGMRYRGPAGMFPPKMTIEQAADALVRIPALHHPGERFTYGFSSDLLGRLIEVWSGKPLDEYMQEAVLDPLTMTDTGFSIPEEKRGRFASCHTSHDGKLAIIDKASSSEFNDGFQFQSGGGGLLSTIHDYASFCRMLVDGGEFRGKRLLKEGTVRLMFTDQLNTVAGDFRFGLGFAIRDVSIGSDDEKRTAKEYSWGGYASTDFRLVPEEKLFQIVVRQRIPAVHGLAGRLFPIVYRGVR